ncbi:MAG: tRNA dihydrouridine(20/20a) synthase DusA, partial [Geminicoccaceae bacterium]|nr:tRNA dihydrouridine(20/20a) synthase DusA [Geminicoccaceae bacterium]
WTDRHCRYLHRLLSRRALLYTEMVTAKAVIHGDRQRLLGFHPAEHPVALQLGGSDPADLAKAARIGEQWGYDEIDLNCGCPSDRVQAGRFGACLMAEPDLVAACVRAMIQASPLPVTVKTRIGIDHTPDEFLDRFVDRVAEAGVTSFVVHARQAWLDGLSPKENREVPPLRYDRVHALARRRPDLAITINGGIRTPGAARAQLDHVAGVMVGREAYQNPMSLPAFERAVFGPDGGAGAPMDEPMDDRAVVERMAVYARAQARRGVPLRAIARHMLGLFAGRPGARAWRRRLSEGMHDPTADADLLRAAADLVDRASRAPAATFC